MRQVEDVLAYARRKAGEVEKDMAWEEREHSPMGGFWTAVSPDAMTQIVARATAIMEFFRFYAGADSFWTERANGVFLSRGENQSTESGARALAPLLREWANEVEAGVTEVAGARAWMEVGLASTDLMIQVRRLLEDRKTHPSAAIVLCGAALEMALKATIEARNLQMPGSGGISKLVQVLRHSGIVTAQDVKDFDQCAGLRNLAAHGEFDALSPERAGLMEQQTNLLLRRLTDLQG